MGLGGILKGIGKVGAVVAAPFTGGASLAAIPMIDAAGQVASAIGGGRAAGRQVEADANQRQDLLRLQAAKLNLDAPGQRAHNSVQGDILANAQPISINGPITHTGGKMPRISGGLSPALLSDNSRQLGQNMSRQALLSQMQGDAFSPTPLPEANGFDKFLNIFGGATGALGSLAAARRPTPAPQIPNLGRVNPMDLPGFQDPRKQVDMAGGL